NKQPSFSSHSKRSRDSQEFCILPSVLT
ncbi:unnamed protein product, partial [Allacma fusca]